MFRNYSNYEVFSDGRIWSYLRNKFLKPQTNHNGYQRVQLFDNEGNGKWYFVHRIVWEAVTGEPIQQGMQINHIDERKYNNARSNLELATPKQNINFGTGISRRAKSQSKRVGAFKNNELVMVFQSTNEAERNGFKHSIVSRCCRNCYLREGNNVYKGFEWKYI